MSLNERSGWRDEGFSKWHRNLRVPPTKLYNNYNLMNIDSLWFEYNNSMPVALMELKHEAAPPVLPDDPNIKALINLANMANLPAFGIRYAGDMSWLRVAPLNDLAKTIIPKLVKMNEAEYVQFLIKLREVAK